MSDFFSALLTAYLRTPQALEAQGLQMSQKCGIESCEDSWKHRTNIYHQKETCYLSLRSTKPHTRTTTIISPKNSPPGQSLDAKPSKAFTFPRAGHPMLSLLVGGSAVVLRSVVCHCMMPADCLELLLEEMRKPLVAGSFYYSLGSVDTCVAACWLESVHTQLGKQSMPNATKPTTLATMR